MVRRIITASFVVVALLGTALVAGPVGAEQASAHRRPIVFVHGFVGSGAQFGTQAMRFTSNGYDARSIAVLEYDSFFATTTRPEVWQDLDALIARLLADTGADRVELVGHSLGTSISQGYLTSSPERAARVAHYVNIDGSPAAAPPAGVPTLAVWGDASSARSIAGATNVYLPEQAHVEVATSAETFDAMYRFFTGRAPKTTSVVREKRVTLSGRVTLFPSNAGAAGTRLEVWEVKERTGFRKGRKPKATFEIGADGSWGPFRGRSSRHYEFALVRDGSTHHFYAEPFVRSDHLVRLITQVPGTGLDALREQSADTTSFTFIRYKELWGDQGADNDVLAIDGVDILTPAVAPRAKRLNALFAFDHRLDGVTDLSAPIPAVAGLPFISGADVHILASTPPDRSIRIEVTPRGGGGTTVLNVPNWPSATDHTSVQLRDFTDGCARRHAHKDERCR